ncbi:unknown [Clostridium sp. CAG:389]|nr:unknown [Clostridium sp. CAG:389]
MMAKTVAGVHTHTHTHTGNLENRININKKIKDRDIVLVSEFDTS